MQQFFGLALPFGLGAPRALDVGARPRVPSIEKEDAGPDMNGSVVIAAEIVVEPVQEQPLDAGVALRPCKSVSGRRYDGLERIRHEDASDYTF